MSMQTYTTAVICCTVFFLFADQNLLAPNLSAIADDFGFDASKRDRLLGGTIAFGFFIVGGLFALIIGYFTDIMNRCLLFGLVVALGESACLATYWVQNYNQLFLCRVLTGISFGGATPIIFSILGDHYAGSSRIYVSTLVGIASSAGVSGGQLLAGMVGPVLGWRAPFLMIGSPAILLAFVVLFTVDEPKRGDQEDAMHQHRLKQQQSQVAIDTNQLSIPETAIVNALHQNALQQQILFSESRYFPQHADSRSVVCAEPRPHNVEVQGQGSSHGNSANPSVDSCADLGSNYVERFNPLYGVELKDSYEDDDEDLWDVAPEELEYSEKLEWKKVVQLFKTPSVLIILCQGLPGCLPWGMIFVFLNDYLSSDRGMTVQGATAALTTFGLGGLVGQIFGGWFGQKLYNRYPPYQCIFMGLSTILAILPAVYVLNAKTVGDLGFFFMIALFGIIINMNGPNVRAVLQNVCMPEIRGTAFSVFTLTDDIGKGLGPALVVLMIEDFHGNRRYLLHATCFVSIHHVYQSYE